MKQRTPSTDKSAEHPVGFNVQAIAKLEREVFDQQTIVDRWNKSRAGVEEE